MIPEAERQCSQMDTFQKKMDIIYFDNSATSFPKAPGLGKAIGEHIDNNGFNICRGSYEKSYQLQSTIIETREQMCSMFGFDLPQNVIFCSGATFGLNLIIKGILETGDHIITSSMEHNSVARPVTVMTSKGIIWDIAKCRRDGSLDPSAVEALICKKTKLVLLAHASNVSGSMMPIDEIGRLCKKHGVFFALDAAQTAGSKTIHMKNSNIDALALPGHKGLLGPQGIGAVLLSERFASELGTVIEGGTGSLSDNFEMPSFMPDKFETGTLNIPGIIGLAHSLKYIKNLGISEINAKKKILTEKFLSGILDIPHVNLSGIRSMDMRCSVISLDFKYIDNSNAAYLLEKDHGIITRCGLHCSPMSHKTLGTYPQGTVRFSIGFFNTEKEVDTAISAINEIGKKHQ